MKRSSLVLMLMIPTVAAAQSIEEKQRREGAVKQVAQTMRTMNKSCKTSAPVDEVIDWGSWKAALNEKDEKESAAQVCRMVPHGMNFLCMDAIAQETVARNVKKISCVRADVTEPKFELKDGTLVVQVSYGLKNVDKQTKTWLSKNLQ